MLRLAPSIPKARPDIKVSQFAGPINAEMRFQPSLTVDGSLESTAN
jgi:hypothetical protein